MGFDLANYETVADRLVRWWAQYPLGRIKTDIYQYDGVHIVMRAMQFVDRRDDGLMHIRDHPGLANFDAQGAKKFRDRPQICVLRPAREQFVPDEDNGGRHDAGHVLAFTAR